MIFCAIRRKTCLLAMVLHLNVISTDRLSGHSISAMEYVSLKCHIKELQDVLQEWYGPAFTIDVPPVCSRPKDDTDTDWGPADVGPQSFDTVSVNLNPHESISGPEASAPKPKPRTLSLLMNFGLDGVSKWSEVEDNGQDTCPNGYIFDPHALICRPAVCVPVKLEAIKPSELCNGQPERRAIKIPTNATRANIFLNLGLPSVTNPDTLRNALTSPNIVKLMEDALKGRLIKFLKVRPYQVINVSIPDFSNMLQEGVRNKGDFTHLDRQNQDGFVAGRQRSRGDKEQEATSSTNLRAEASFVLLHQPSEDSEVRAESLVEMYDKLAQAVLSPESLIFTVAGVEVKIFAIWEEGSGGYIDVSASTSWCKDGTPAIYCNNDIDLELNGNSSKATVKATNITYGCGEFKIHLYLKEFNQKPHLSQVAVVCEGPPANLVCPDQAAMFVAEYAILLANKSLIFEHKLYTESEYLYRQSTDQYLLCGVKKAVTSRPSNSVLGFNMRHDITYISMSLSICSMAALIVTLIIYGVYADLRTLPGCNLINVMLTLIVAELALLLNTAFSDESICTMIGIITHFAYLLSFFFSNVIAINIYRTFGQGRLGSFRVPTNGRNAIGTRLLKNMAFCYVSTGLIVGAAVILDQYDVPDWKVEYRELCWIAGQRASLIFFALPMILIYIVNAVLIGVTFYRMRKHKKSMNGLRVNNAKNCSKDGSKQEAVSYVRIGTVFGFTWIFGIVAGFVRDAASKEGEQASLIAYEVMTYIFVLTQSCQGLLIFLAFGLNARVRAMLVSSYKRLRSKFCTDCDSKMCECLSKSTITKGHVSQYD